MWKVIVKILEKYSMEKEWRTHAKYEQLNVNGKTEWVEEILICNNTGSIKRIRYGNVN
jgi:hypothetical protein